MAHSYKFIFYFHILLIQPLTGTSQSDAVFRVEKENRFVLFFQKGAKSDTIVPGKSDLFYFLVPDSAKQNIMLNIENGQLVKTTNDSLVQFFYLPGLRYEYAWETREDISGSLSGKKSRAASNKKSGIYKSLINGTSSIPAPTIHIRVLNQKSGKVLSELRWYYRS